ncbi:organ-specific protein P4-like [Cucurbita moschata]|uniref:Organ-specific protein P4-like n=1 Tax=Cucurbita moschata TaxID=3662 RepID=A0A6J1G7K5_CUCMO|nr:organ-specific protein P4-like [Cucurbita moschata]
MKLSAAFFLLFLILLANVSHARKEKGEYWKKVMKDEAIPEMLKELLFDDDSLVSSDAQSEHFMNNFDTHPNAIIYHSHGATHDHPGHKTKPSAP